AYDHTALRPLRPELTARRAAVRDCRRRAGRCLGAAEEIRRDVRAILATPALRERAVRRAQGILRREIPPRGGGAGLARQLFLDAVTGRGLLRLDGTVLALCRRVYVLEDGWGLSHLLLSHLLGGALAAGYGAAAGPAPLCPGRLAHLLIPELSLGFVSASPALPYRGGRWRTVRMDAMAETEGRNRPRLRFAKKMTQALLEEAAQALAEAGDAWAGAQALYRPHVNTAWAERAAERLMEEIFDGAAPLILSSD
ncbi:MAG: hypothetical protein LUE91_04180, partial [Oscillospiraceae bacterium]|nr:hypothetical protein [Oscillospiraceae bacterium]